MAERGFSSLPSQVDDVNPFLLVGLQVPIGRKHSLSFRSQKACQDQGIHRGDPQAGADILNFYIDKYS
jgi:hypothetical protein